MTTTTEPDWVGHARRLADLLRDRGDIRSPGWHAAVAGVPRHVFVPRVHTQDDTGHWSAWDTAGHPERVYAPETLVTALEDRDGYQAPVSSSTKPDLMTRMLETLDVQDGHRVLEIGTGSGYNAALLSHRLGDEHVFSIDVDPDLVTHARERLTSVGYRPTLAAVDGTGGLPEHAPYDRIIATCSVPAIPWEWAEQLAPGGTILVDYKLAISAGNLVHLHRDGDVLQGRFTAWSAAFMPMRHTGQHVPTPRPGQVEGGQPRPTSAPTQPWTEPLVWFLAQIGGLPRGVVFGFNLDSATQQPSTAFLAAPDGSRAHVHIADRTVTEAGDTPLWAPVERAHRLWVAAGQPGWERLGLRVEPDGQHTVWLDEPGHTIRV